MVTNPELTRHAEHRSAGMMYGVLAYGLWGAMPLYFRQLAVVPPLETLAHRAWWSFLLVTLLVVLGRKHTAVRAALRDRRTCTLLLASTMLIAANWLTYIYAVASQQVVQAGLGYFMTPLANVLLGVAVLGERLRPLQLGAVALATLGVVVLIVYGGAVPWIALALAITFSTYGLLRKLAAVEALLGLFIETTLLAPAALGYLTHLAWRQEGLWGQMSASLDGWLVASGPVTTLPLVCFAAAARRLPLNTLGFLQFLTPSLQMIVALALFQEPFSSAQGGSFALIWIAVGCYLFDAWRARPRRSS